MEAKFAYGCSILSSSQFLLLSPAARRNEVVKIDSKNSSGYPHLNCETDCIFLVKLCWLLTNTLFVKYVLRLNSVVLDQGAMESYWGAIVF